MKSVKPIVKNVSVSILPQVVNIITNLILPTLIISLYGSELNGLVSTSKTIANYVSLVGAGIALAVTQALYAPVAKQDVPTVRGMLSAADRMFKRYGCIYVAILTVVALVYPFLIRGSIPFHVTALLILVMGIAGGSEFFVVGRCRALLYAHQKVYVCTLIQAISLAVSLAVAIVTIKLGWNIILVELAISSVYILRAFFLHLYVKHFYPMYANVKGVTPIGAAVSKKNDAMIHQLTGLVATGSQTLILSSLVGLNAASIYAVYNIVFSGLTNICSNVNTAIMPFLGKGLAVDSKESIRRKYDLTEIFFHVMTTAVFAIAALLILPFVRIYTAGADINYIYVSFAMLFVFVTASNIIRLPGSAMIYVAGHFKETKSRALTEAGICVAVSVGATLWIGMNGVLIGTLVASVWRSIDMLVYANHRILKASCVRSVLRFVRSMAIIGLAVWIAVRNPIEASGYGEWIRYALPIALIVLVGVAVETVVFEWRLIASVLKRKK